MSAVATCLSGESCLYKYTGIIFDFFLRGYNVHDKDSVVKHLSISQLTKADICQEFDGSI